MAGVFADTVTKKQVHLFFLLQCFVLEFLSLGSIHFQQLFVSYLHPKRHIADLSRYFVSVMKRIIQVHEVPMLPQSAGHRALKSSDSRSHPLSGWLMVIGQDIGNLHQCKGAVPGLLRFD